MLHGLPQPLAQAEENARQLVLRLGQQLGVAVRVVDRLAQQGLRGAQVVVIAAHERKAHEGARASGAALRGADQLLEHAARAVAVAGLEDAGRGLRGAAPGIDVAPGRREAQGALEQVGGRRRRPAGRGSPRGVLERARHRLVGAGGGQREVSCPLLRLAHPLGDRRVQGAPRRRVGCGVGAGGQQRVGEAHDAVADGDDLGALGLRQHIVAGHRVHDRERRLGHRGGHGEARGERRARGRPSER